MNEMDMTIEEYWYWLATVPFLGPVNTRRLLDMAGGSPEAVYYGDFSSLNERQRSAVIESRLQINDRRREFARLCADGVRLINYYDEDYPARLRLIYDPPMVLFEKGKHGLTGHGGGRLSVADDIRQTGRREQFYSAMRRENSTIRTQDTGTETMPDAELLLSGPPSVAIVGARKATDYGSAFAERLSRELSEAGVTVVSGMAEGIDGAGHRGALSGSGKTVAVLGTGIDVIYPAFHRKLYHEICERGSVISEFGAGIKGFKMNFVQRNRLISGLAQVVIIVEARERSGSLITAEYAIEQGRGVMAVPGRPDDMFSTGTNLLIKDGADCCTCTDDVLSRLSIDRALPAAETHTLVLDDEEKRVYELVRTAPRHTDEISERTGLAVNVLYAILLKLQLAELIDERAGIYSAKR